MKRLLYLFILLVFFLCNCKKDTTLKLDTDSNDNVYCLSTIEAYNKVNISAYSGGVFFSEKAYNYTKYGVCWSLNQYPTINDYKFELSGATPYPSFTYSCLMDNLTPNKTYYARAYAISDLQIAYGNQISFMVDGIRVQSLLDQGSTPYQVNQRGFPVDSLYGKVYKDGYIFYFDTLDGSGMVASTSPEVNKTWGSSTYIFGTLPGFGTGSNNTNSIIDGYGVQDIAARVCRISVSDTGWFLPSKDELNLMFQNLKSKGYGHFHNGSYWSSTQQNMASGWSQDFNSGLQSYKSKSLNYLVRCVMKF
jgi:hypothetical protein